MVPQYSLVYLEHTLTCLYTSGGLIKINGSMEKSGNLAGTGKFGGYWRLAILNATLSGGIENWEV